jgi:deoxyribodipyrimidine photolyase
MSGNSALAEAQKLALQLEVPLAVTYCLAPRGSQMSRAAYGELVGQLREVEAGLAAFGIPFVLLLGDARQRLGGLVYHFKPQAVFFDCKNDIAEVLDCAAWLAGDRVNGSNVIEHPYIWSGSVLSIGELASRIEEMAEAKTVSGNIC